MKLLEHFITQIDKQPTDWTSQDIQKYMDYVKTHVTDITVLKRYDGLLNFIG